MIWSLFGLNASVWLNFFNYFGLNESVQFRFFKTDKIEPTDLQWLILKVVQRLRPFFPQKSKPTHPSFLSFFPHPLHRTPSLDLTCPIGHRITLPQQPYTLLSHAVCLQLLSIGSFPLFFLSSLDVSFPSRYP